MQLGRFLWGPPQGAYRTTLERDMPTTVEGILWTVADWATPNVYPVLNLNGEPHYHGQADSCDEAINMLRRNGTPVSTCKLNTAYSRPFYQVTTNH